jgi:hypothetical protein
MVTATRREKSVLSIEEMAMNTTTIAGELTERHDPREASRLNLIERDLEDLRSYVTGGIGEQLIEHALMHIRIAQREDELENRSHTYIVAQSRGISELTQERLSED